MQLEIFDAGAATQRRRTMLAPNSVRFLCCSLILAASALQAQRRVAKLHPAQGSGTVLFAQDCAACHGSDGRGGERAPNIATEHEIVSLSDAQLRGILRKGVLSAGMPSFSYLGDENIHALVHYLRDLQGMTSSKKAELPGDPHAGEAIFFGKASCSRCHMVHGRGGFMGDDLSEYARGHSVKSIEAAIVDPNENVSSSGRMTTIETSDGATYRGLVRARDNFTVVLQSKDGVFHSIAREKIKRMDSSEGSMMPQDYGKTLDNKQMNDLVSYLLKSAGSGSSKAAGKRDAE